jgi:hypothetical protein
MKIPECPTSTAENSDKVKRNNDYTKVMSELRKDNESPSRALTVKKDLFKEGKFPQLEEVKQKKKNIFFN